MPSLTGGSENKPGSNINIHYPEILARVKAGQIVLDLGCCFGQDLRLLAADGASPSETQMYASDISEHLWELGFDLFQDRDRMHARFIQADILDPTSGLKQLNGKVDIVLANQFLHLFDWERQMIAMRNIVQLSKPGSLIVGHQRGQETPLVIKRSWGNMYIHNEDSWRRIWQEVNEETDTVWEVEAVMTDLSEWGMVQEDIEWMPEGKKGINFAIRRTS
ncbi:hypothetical protein ACLMJK_008691 [Lecanora helva]